MSLYAQFETDNSLEREGILLEYGVNKAGKPITIRIARAGGANTAFTKQIDIRTKPVRRQIQNETIERAMIDRILRETYASSVVLGWENVEDKDGKPLPFNRDNCLQLFEDLPDLFADIQEQSQRVALFRAEVREADAKN